MDSNKTKPREKWENIELALSSKGRLRILRKLAKNGPTTQHQLIKYTGLKTQELKRQLKILLNIGWIEELPYNPKKYRINPNNRYVIKLSNLFKKSL